MLNSFVFSIQRGGNADIFSEDTVELGEAIKAAEGGDLGDGNVRIDEQGLHIADSGHLNIIGDGEAGDILKTVGEIADADVVGLSQHFKT